MLNAERELVDVRIPNIGIDEGDALTNESRHPRTCTCWLNQPGWEGIGDGAGRSAARVLRGDVRRVLAEAGGYAAVRGRKVEYRPAAMQHRLILEPESRADPRLKVIEVAIEGRARRAVLANESDAPIDLHSWELFLIDTV